MQELEVVHALKKENGIILVSQVQIFILDSLKMCFEKQEIRWIFLTQLTNLNQLLS